MNVVKQFPADLDNRTVYRMMKSPEVKKMISAADSILDVRSWVMFTDGDYSVLTIETQDGEMFGTISETFMRTFEDIVKFFGDDVGSVKVVSGTSKAGRTYITCTPV